MYAFSVSYGAVSPSRSFQMTADDGEHKSPIRPAKLPETNIENRAGVIGGLPLFLVVDAIHRLRRFTHSAQRNAMVRELEKGMLHDRSGHSTSELMAKVTKLVTLEINELHLMVYSAQKDADKARHEAKLLKSQLEAAQQLVRNWEDRGQTEIAKTARRLFAELGSTRTKAARAEREILTLREQVARLQSQRNEARADIIKLCIVWSLLLIALGKFLADGSEDIAHLFYR